MLSTTTSNQIIARLARACGLPWAKSAELPPTMSAWQDEWKRYCSEGHAPAGASGPSSFWMSDDGRVSWTVDGTTYVRIRVGCVVMVMSSRGWYADADSRSGPVEDWAECLRLMKAVEASGTLQVA